MADLEPSSEKRERILQALDEASKQKLQTKGYEEKDGQPEMLSAWGTKKENQKNPKSAWQIFCDCIHVNETVIDKKLIYFMLSAGSAGAIPFLSMYGERWGIPPWHLGLAVGAGLLAAFFFVPLWGFVADKLRFHRGMFWAVVLLWMGFTIAAVVKMPPEVVSCEVAQGQLLEALGVSCNEHDPKSTPSGQGEAYFEFMGHYPILMPTWPEPCTVDVLEVCTSYNESETITPLATDSSIDEVGEVATQKPLPSPSLSNSRNIQSRAQQPQTSNTSEASDGVYRVLRGTHLGWLYDEAQLHRASVIVFILAALGGVAQISAFSMADAAALMSLGEGYRDRYGWQRCFGTMGFALSSVTVAIMLYASRRTKTLELCGLTWEETDYFVGVVVFAGFMTIGVFVSSCVQFKHTDMSSQHTLSQVTGAIFSRNSGSVFVTAFFLSFGNGASSTFLYWHVHKMGATPVLLGAAIMVFALADILTSYCTVWIVRKAGYHVPLVVGITGYCLVYLSYALMSRPGWVVVVEIMHGASYAITLNTMTSYLASSVALVSQATVQGLLSGVYWGLGPAAGTALFGYLLDVIGATLSFYALTLVSVVYGLIFLIWNRHELPLIDKYLPREYQSLNQDGAE